MKRHITLATLATLSLASVPAFAQDYVRAPRDYRSPRALVTGYSPASGPIGTTVTISGDNFAQDVKVNFGGVLVTPTYVTDDLVSFKIPAGADDASISLDMPGSRRDLSVGSFNVLLPTYDDDNDIGYGRGNRYDDDNGYDRGYDKGYGRGYGKGYKAKTWSRSSIRGRYHRGFLRLPAVRSEMSLHAERTARLNRMMRLSIGRPRMTHRIQIALNREDRRHDRKMAALKAEFGRIRYVGSAL